MNIGGIEKSSNANSYTSEVSTCLSIHTEALSERADERIERGGHGYRKVGQESKGCCVISQVMKI